MHPDFVTILEDPAALPMELSRSGWSIDVSFPVIERDRALVCGVTSPTVGSRVLKRTFFRPEDEDFFLRQREVVPRLVGRPSRRLTRIHQTGVVSHVTFRERWFLLERAEGTLADLLRDVGTKKQSDRDRRNEIAERLLRDGLKAIGHCERLGIVHHDFKPGNLFHFGEHSRRGFVLGDFDAAIALDHADPIERVYGSPPYLSPQAAEGAIDPTADLFALGATLVEVITGTKPRSAREADNKRPFPDETYSEILDWRMKSIAFGLTSPNPDGRTGIAELGSVVTGYPGDEAETQIASSGESPKGPAGSIADNTTVFVPPKGRRGKKHGPAPDRAPGGSEVSSTDLKWWAKFAVACWIATAIGFTFLTAKLATTVPFAETPGFAIVVLGRPALLLTIGAICSILVAIVVDRSRANVHEPLGSVRRWRFATIASACGFVLALTACALYVGSPTIPAAVWNVLPISMIVGTLVAERRRTTGGLSRVIAVTAVASVVATAAFIAFANTHYIRDSKRLTENATALVTGSTCEPAGSYIRPQRPRIGILAEARCWYRDGDVSGNFRVITYKPGAVAREQSARLRASAAREPRTDRGAACSRAPKVREWKSSRGQGSLVCVRLSDRIVFNWTNDVTGVQVFMRLRPADGSPWNWWHSARNWSPPG